MSSMCSPGRPTSDAAPRSVYIHVPFCARRCGYCNFTLVAGRGDLVERYLRAIELEVAQLGESRSVDTLFFGGGTPTFLSPHQLRQLAETVLRWHPLAPDYEWTVEANPNDVDTEMAETLSALGVNRLSLGAQSFRAEKLRLLERGHKASDVERAAQLARAAGMAVALDLIFAVPGETLADWTADLDAALALAPDHISAYGLTIERGTAFFGRRLRGETAEVDEELQRDMYLLTIDRLAAAGLAQYEISNFARPGCRSRHNEAYWLGQSYYAYGPGAARYVDGVRETNHRSTTTYLKRVLSGVSPVADRERLDPERRAREMLVFGLRRIEGIQRQSFADRTGFTIDALIAKPLKKFVALGLLAEVGDQIQLTREGLLVSDAIWPEML